MRILITLVLFNLISTALADQVVVRYGFDESRLPKAEDGFFIFENSKGYVEPSPTEKFSGYRSLELQEEPLDGQFVELQGIFDPLSSGDVLFHFALFVMNPDQELNIALAGPEHFSLRPNGIAFWLKSEEGVLFHHSDSIPKKLMPLESSKWYIFDAVIHLERGTYDLRVLDSAGNLISLLKDQPNAIKAPGSAIAKLSFIGDLEDRSNVHYYVDDVEIRTLSHPLNLDSVIAADSVRSSLPSDPNDSGIDSRDFINKGQPTSPRLSYLDEYLELKKLEFGRPQCLPALSLRDFGITPSSKHFDIEALSDIRSSIRDTPNRSEIPENPTARGITLWRLGCLEMSAGKFKESKEYLIAAHDAIPQSPVILAALVTLGAATKNVELREFNLVKLYPYWADDARLPILLGNLAFGDRQYEDAAQALGGLGDRVRSEDDRRILAKLLVGDHSGLDELKEHFGSKWRYKLDELFINQGYYYSLLFSSRFGEAAGYAENIATKYGKLNRVHELWAIRKADALFLSGEKSKGINTLTELEPNCFQCKEIESRIRDWNERNK